VRGHSLTTNNGRSRDHRAGSSRVERRRRRATPRGTRIPRSPGSTLIRAAQAPAVHEDLAVTTGSLGHQTPAESSGSRCSQVAVALGPAEPGAPELEHAVDIAVKPLARPGLGDLYGQIPQLALDVQHWGKIRFSTHETSLPPGTDRKAPRCSVEIGAVERAHFLIKTASVPQSGRACRSRPPSTARAASSRAARVRADPHRGLLTSVILGWRGTSGRGSRGNEELAGSGGCTKWLTESLKFAWDSSTSI
jgi:hypothetical protein